MSDTQNGMVLPHNGTQVVEAEATATAVTASYIDTKLYRSVLFEAQGKWAN